VSTSCAAGQEFEPILAPNAQVTSGTTGVCLFCSVSNESRVIDVDLTNFARMNVGVGIAGGMFIEVEDTDSVHAAGSRVGYVVSNPGSLLQLDLLQGITLRTYLNGVARDTASYGALLNLDLIGLSGDSANTLVSFTATQSFDEIRIGYSAVLGALSDLDVSRACVDPTP
jgi:hypothetical protein